MANAAAVDEVHQEEVALVGDHGDNGAGEREEEDWQRAKHSDDGDDQLFGSHGVMVSEGQATGARRSDG